MTTQCTAGVPASQRRRPLDAEPVQRLQARTTNNPLRRINRHTPQGRRVADLFRGYWHHMGRPTDAIVQANALAAAELKVAAEDARAALLAGTGDGDLVVRLENLAHRAERKLGIKVTGKAAKPLAETLAEIFAKGAADQAAQNAARSAPSCPPVRQTVRTYPRARSDAGPHQRRFW